MTLLSCNDISLGYDGEAILEHLTFQVKKGDYLCIVGENGSGKSTLVKALLNTKAPLCGKLEMMNISSNEIGYLPQQTEVQRDFPATVREIVLSGLLSHLQRRPFYNKHEKQIAFSNMEKLGISHLAKKCYRELSGGQQQRVLLARALCATGQLLLLDEPVVGLDPKATEEFYELISHLNTTENLTIIMVTHDIPSALRYSNHILHIAYEPLFFGATSDYELFLGKKEGSL